MGDRFGTRGPSSREPGSHAVVLPSCMILSIAVQCGVLTYCIQYTYYSRYRSHLRELERGTPPFSPIPYFGTLDPGVLRSLTRLSLLSNLLQLSHILVNLRCISWPFAHLIFFVPPTTLPCHFPHMLSHLSKEWVSYIPS